MLSGPSVPVIFSSPSREAGHSASDAKASTAVPNVIARIIATVTNKSKRFKSCLPLSYLSLQPPWAAVTHISVPGPREAVHGPSGHFLWYFWPPPYGTFGHPAYGPLDHSLSRIISYLCVSLLSLSERGTVRLLVSGQRFGGTRVPGVLSMG